ncbi:hypothetical protein ASF21_10815 [Arthrobacter sp. Leaf234]|uniref:GAF and ANTAR domain-containing protein n=1 Tax=Arthrobacter sp. Leaf234 TaxID=1736303 RepID=UPI0006F47661|nr:GAF and ANTAR domain-containing protein [Arthrobacter sp. Leaf234]KQO00802.1 hypothetical protein ASF21_10815 [Arthrobacter sp. Leaf234]
MNTPSTDDTRPTSGSARPPGTVPGSDQAQIGDELFQAVVDSGDLIGYLDHVTSLAVDVLRAPGRTVFCGVTVLRSKKAATVASSSEQARRMDEVQYRYDDGPCLTAAREEREIYIPQVTSLADSSPYRQAMEDHGVHTVLAVPIILPGETYSALNLYSDTDHAFNDNARHIAHRFANQVSATLEIAIRMTGLVDAGEDLRAAMKNRATINTAVGIIMAQNTCSQEEAFAILSQAASTRNIKIWALADTLITSVTGNRSTPS